VARTVTIGLTPFEREALARYGATQRVPVERVVRTAILYYLRERHSGRPTWPMPPVPREEALTDAQVDVELGQRAWQTLAEEAASQAVAPETLARHALLFFLADADSGRLAAAVERALRAD
jgi:glutathione S-transferase